MKQRSLLHNLCIFWLHILSQGCVGQSVYICNVIFSLIPFNIDSFMILNGCLVTTDSCSGQTAIWPLFFFLSFFWLVAWILMKKISTWLISQFLSAIAICWFVNYSVPQLLIKEHEQVFLNQSVFLPNLILDNNSSTKQMNNCKIKC